VEESTVIGAFGSGERIAWRLVEGFDGIDAVSLLEAALSARKWAALDWLLA
jgi:hypothetical protein